MAKGFGKGFLTGVLSTVALAEAQSSLFTKQSLNPKKERSLH